MAQKWEIKNVPAETRQKIKAKAALKGLTIGQLLTQYANEP